MIIVKIILYGILYIFIGLTIVGTVRFFIKTINNILTPPYRCIVEVVDKRDKLIMIPSRGAGTWCTVYTLDVRFTDLSIKTFKISLDDYIHIEQGYKCEFLVSNDEIKEYKILEVA